MEQLPPFQRLEKISGQVDSVLLELRQQYQEILDELKGVTYDTIEQRQEISERINTIASKIGCSFRCTTCGDAAGFRWDKAGTGRLGGFAFSHTRGSTHRVGSQIPKLISVDRPESQRWKKTE